MLTTLGIYAVVSFSSVLIQTLQSQPHSVIQLLSELLIIIMIFFIAWLFIFKNDSLARTIPGDHDDLQEIFDQRRYLIKALRIGFVLLGLLMLAGSIRYFGMLFKYFSMINIRLWISKVIETKSIADNLWLSTKAKRYIYGLFKLILIVYLLYGALHLIRWHTMRLNEKTEGI
jgi:hypothetical protein